jgi:hypothetical protein
MSLTS